ncbi:MAG: CBS domain-containing protein [Deltaproteobacteria bacterium]|nr:CBS domain-containing protein [Candidatus Anaeroferrophillus wilburensis]MBN2889085.1 CBS domain-containing protein [Deltaproteobacteria bacterium]
MAKISDVLKEKGTQVYSVDRQTTVYDAIKLMAEKNVGGLVVTAAGQVVGIITERDYLKKVILQGKASNTTAVEEIMTEKVVVVTPDQTVESCMAIMAEKNCRHLPVMEQGVLAGVVSILDLTRQLTREQQTTIKYLQDYIYGKC